MHLTSDLVGKPCEFGAKGPDKWDCWSLAAEVFRRLGIELPDYRVECDSISDGMDKKSQQWARCSGEIPVPALIVFKTAGIPNHVGVYLGGGRFIHAHETAGVSITPVDHVFWKKRIEGYYVPGWLNESSIHQKPDHAR